MWKSYPSGSGDVQVFHHLFERGSLLRLFLIMQSDFFAKFAGIVRGRHLSLFFSMECYATHYAGALCLRHHAGSAAGEWRVDGLCYWDLPKCPHLILSCNVLIDWPLNYTVFSTRKPKKIQCRECNESLDVIQGKIETFCPRCIIQRDIADCMLCIVCIDENKGEIRGWRLLQLLQLLG